METGTLSQYLHDVRTGLAHILDIRPAMIPQPTWAAIEDAVKAAWPDKIRHSALRKLLDGELGIEKPFSTVADARRNRHVREVVRAQDALAMLLASRYALEKPGGHKPPPIKKQAKVEPPKSVPAPPIGVTCNLPKEDSDDED